MRVLIPFARVHLRVSLPCCLLEELYWQATAGIWGFCGNYTGSIKEPAYSFRPRGLDGKPKWFPSVVLESSWTSTEPEPVDVSRLWHEGSGGRVRVVILVKLDKPNAQNQSKAALEISHCTPGAAASATTTQIVYLLCFTISFSQTPFYWHSIGCVSGSWLCSRRSYYYHGRTIRRAVSTRL